jgi:hypothetical protein
VQVQVLTTDLARAAIIDPAAAVVLTDLVEAPKRKTWIARHRTGRVVGRRANAFRTFNAAGVIASVVAEDSAVVAAVGSGVGDNN